jgi:hypothetical protein
MSDTAALPSPKGTNYARLYITTRAPVRLATDASPMNAGQFPKGLKPIGNDRKKRWSGRDADPLADALDAMQEHLQNCISDSDDLNQAQALLQRLLETAMPDNGEQSEDDGEGAAEQQRRDPDAQRRDPGLFQAGDRGRRMAGDRAPAGKLAQILAAKTR